MIRNFFCFVKRLRLYHYHLILGGFAGIYNFTFNLVRVYINGCIDRAYVLNDTELQELVNSTLQIAPTTSDIDFYLFRVYNNEGLSDSIV